MWSVYSKPVPENYKDVCLLLSICLCITISSGSLLYNWMFSSLRYSFRLSLATSTVFSFLFLLLLVFVHPVRCVMTISIPTLGTKQGRRLLLSTCSLIITFHIFPNIAENICTMLEFLKCISQTSSESLLNSTTILEQSATEFGQEVTKVTLKQNGGGLKFFSSVDKSTVRNQMLNFSEKIKTDFSNIESVVAETILGSNRIIACFFVVCLLSQSAWYLKSYLTNLKFNNIYITKKLEDLAQRNNKKDIITSSSIKLIKSTGWKLSKEECFSCLFRILSLSLFFTMIAVIIVMDHIVFFLAVAIREWADNFPTVPLNLEIMYNVQISIMPLYFGAGKISNHLFDKKYQTELSFVSSHCVLQPRAPQSTAIFTVALIYCLACALIFLQTYAHRLCRKISASFFEKQEEARIQYLFQKLLQKHRRKQKVFF
ncbi:osteoclast stimulatory transmembrane protein isoform X2 [Lissotriton helveticus]